MATVLKKCECSAKSKCKHPWTVRFRTPGGRAGKQVEESFPRKRDADDFAVKVENDKREGVYLDRARGRITVQDWVKQWLSVAYHKPRTRRGYEEFFGKHVFPLIGNRAVSSIYKSDIERVVSGMKSSGLEASTITARMIPLSGAFTAAVEDERIRKNPCRGVKVPDVPVKEVWIPTTEQVHALALAMSPEWAVFVWLAAGCGMRMSEIFALSSSRLHLGEDFVHIERQVTATGDKPDGTPGAVPELAPLKHRKPGEYRDVPLAGYVADKVRSHVENFGTHTIDGEAGFLLRAPRGGFARARTFYDVHWHKATKAAGLPDDFTPHDLRHYFASAALADGVQMMEVSRWLGHASIQITVDLYGHLTQDAPGRLRGAIDRALRPQLDVARKARTEATSAESDAASTTAS